MRRVLAVILAFCSVSLPAAERYRISEASAMGPSSPLLIVLHDEEAGIRAAIAPSEGGELSGLELRFQNEWIETIYRARDYSPVEGFAGRSMFLWPAAGSSRPVSNEDVKRVRSGYELNGKLYPMPGHGFARSMPWKEVSREAATDGVLLSLELTDTPETRRQYPFGFRILAAYRLTNGELEITYTVRAAPDNAGPMPFSAGNHVTFLAPLVPGSAAGEITLETPSGIEYLKESGLPTGRSRSFSYDAPTRLADIPRLTAISLGKYSGDPYLVLRDPQGLGVRIVHTASSVPGEPVVRFNLWGDPEGGYYSPEPWVGLQNSLNLKQGLVRLNPGQEWEWSIRIQPLGLSAP